MSIKNSIVTNGLTFYYDMFNDKSFRGAPTTNIEENGNADRNMTQSDAFSSYSGTVSGGRWALNHHDAIKVYNRAGSNISSKINSGVQNYKNTYHGIWTYEEELGYPVVTMRDIGDGSWMYAGFGIDGSYNTPAKCGLGLGDNYVISWDQWTTNTSKSANCGLYGQNTTGTQNNFHDGLSNSSGTGKKYNTRTHTWERLWCIFTIGANRGLNATWSQYNYGHYGGRGITKVANWQLEVGNTPSKYVIPKTATSTQTRSNTESIVDLAPNPAAITQTNLTYSIANTTDLQLPERFSFTNSTSRLDIESSALSAQASSGTWTIDIWLKRTALSSGDIDTFLQTGSANNFLWYFRQTTGNIEFENTAKVTWSFTPTTDVYYHFVATGSGGSVEVFINGVSLGTRATTSTFSIAYANGICVGQELDSNSATPSVDPNQRFQGEIPSMKFYNRVLSDTEILQNFNASRGNYGV